MKLHQVDYSQTKPPEPDEFAIYGDGDKLVFVQHCPKFGSCRIQIHEAPPSHPVWMWNGNKDEPTITPSIGCDLPSRCGKHVSIINGNKILG